MKQKLLLKSGWFLVSDKWHRNCNIHYLLEGKNKSICGMLEITQTTIETIIYFETINNINVGDICKKCLRSQL